MKVKAEYIWVDNTNHSNSTIRSKTKVLDINDDEFYDIE